MDFHENVMEDGCHSTEWTAFTFGVDPNKGRNILRKGFFFTFLLNNTQILILNLVSGEFRWRVSMNDYKMRLLGHSGGKHCTDCHS